MGATHLRTGQGVWSTVGHPTAEDTVSGHIRVWTAGQQESKWYDEQVAEQNGHEHILSKHGACRVCACVCACACVCVRVCTCACACACVHEGVHV